MSKNNATILLIAFILITFFSGCVSSWRIGYKIDKIEASKTTLLSGYVFDVQPFEDVRKSLPENEKLFSGYNYTGGAFWDSCINGEVYYIYKQGDKESPWNITVPEKIAVYLAAHLKKRGTFKSVTAKNKAVAITEEGLAVFAEQAGKSKKAPADFYLTGKLRRFFGEQEYSRGVAAGQAFGLIGALATSGTKTSGRIIIEYIDLRLYKRNGTLVGKIGNIYDKFEGELIVDAYCNVIYWHVNRRLMHANEKLAGEIEKSLLEAVSK